MNLEVLIEPELQLDRLVQVLDELGHLGRVDAVRRWGKATQARLFEAIAGKKSIGLDDFVPAGKGPLEEVIHEGKNTLGAFTLFQKRFCKPGEGMDGLLYGYNHQTMAAVTGPGYFVVKPGETSGEVDIDYREIPKTKPAAWPAIQANTGIGGLVYGGMVDVMRGLSSHVTIGRAKKKGKYMDAWFVLVREDG